MAVPYYFVGQSVGSANNGGPVAGTTGTFSGLVSAGSLAVTGAATFGASTIAQAAVSGLVSGLAAKATDSLVVHLAGIETITGAKTFSALTTFNGEADFASGTEAAPKMFVGSNGFYASGTLLGVTFNAHKLLTVQPGLTVVYDGTASNLGGSMQAGQFAFGSTTVDRNNHANAGWINSGGVGIIQFTGANVVPATTASVFPTTSAVSVDAAGGSQSLAKWESGCLYTSSPGATTRTLPTPANSYVGQLVYVVQEASAVFTLGVPTGVTVSMQTAAGTITSKTATNFATSGLAASNGASAQLICTSTDTSTVATWRQVGGIGLWV